jgi:hypothetical protein
MDPLKPLWMAAKATYGSYTALALVSVKIDTIKYMSSIHIYFIQQ